MQWMLMIWWCIYIVARVSVSSAYFDQIIQDWFTAQHFLVYIVNLSWCDCINKNQLIIISSIKYDSNKYCFFLGR